MKNIHILLVVFPVQGHINPCLQFAYRLLKMGIKVTFNTSIGAYRRIPETDAAAAAAAGINFVTFSDGYDNGFKAGESNQAANHMAFLNTNCPESMKEIIAESDKEGDPVTAVVYSLFQPWAGLTARELHVPSALLWTMPASFLDIYYCYYNGYSELLHSAGKDPSLSVELPGLPLLKSCDFPTFLLDSKNFTLPSFKDQLDILDEEKKPIVLVNTFDALEQDALQAISKYKMFAVGPLITPSLSDSQDPSEQKCNYIEYLNSNKDSSVVYLAFGSLLPVEEAQLEEIARGILATKRPFLWVIRGSDKDETILVDYMEELTKQGMIVPWCLQLDVLTHPSLGCFVSHCGWNSTTESLTCGVPVVAFPHWMDQMMNAKFIEDVWCTGVKLRARGEDGIVESDEVTRCVETVMDGGKKSNELRKNALKWKGLANEAMKDGGCIDKNLEEFVRGLLKN